jgi:hypothetical protein
MGFLFGGPSSETSVEIPAWLEDAWKPLMEGTASKYGDWQQQLWDLAMGGDSPILGDLSRGVVGPSYQERRAADLTGKLTQGDPNQGKASNIANMLSQLNDYERTTNRLASVYADPRNSPYEHKRATDMYNLMARAAQNPVDFSGYQSDPLFQQQMEAWDANVDPIITNSANAMGLGRFGVKAAAKGLSKTNAVRDALQGFINQGNINRDREIGGLGAAAGGMAGQAGAVRGARTQNLNTRMGLGSQLRGGRESAMNTYLGIGDRNYQKKLDAINQYRGIGETFRGINQERSDAGWEDVMRRAAMFENALTGPMGQIPGMFGSSSSQQKKNK